MSGKLYLVGTPIGNLGDISPRCAETLAEVDFIAERQSERIYIQVCYILATPETVEREFGVYRNIRDNYPKYVLSMDEFDMSQLNDSVSPVFLRELASCKFIQERKNIVMIGNPGRGKTHIAIALGIRACLQGFRVLFKNASTLSVELTEARDNYQLGKLERQLEKTDLLILDELSYLSFNRYESDLLFKVLSDRSERTSTIVTTNLPFSRWTELFENTTMVSALVDRLTFRSHVLDMNGPSFRLMETQGGSDIH